MRRYPSEAGLAAAVADLEALPVDRLAAHVPVLLAIESALEAGDFEDVDVVAEGGLGTVPAVPNHVLFQRLERWFRVEGQPDFPYFSPVRLPGGRESLHWRTRGIVAQNTMSAAKNRRWVKPAVPLEGSRGYPLVDIADWRQEAARSVGDGDRFDGGIDLATLGIWLARKNGVPCERETPDRAELVAAALDALGLGTHSHPLNTDPALLSEGGDYVPLPEHFGPEALSEAAITRAALAVEEAPAEEEAPVDNTDELIPDDDWLRERFEEWKGISGYPTSDDQRNQEMRKEFADGLFDEAILAAGQLDLPLFRRFVVGNYGGPGNQSHIMRFLRDNPETGPSRLAETIHHLLYGDDDAAARLRDVLEDPASRIPGFAESLATKCLAVRYPEQWIPLFVHRSGSGVGKRDFLRIIKSPALDETGKGAIVKSCG